MSKGYLCDLCKEFFREEKPFGTLKYGTYDMKNMDVDMELCGTCYENLKPSVEIAIEEFHKHCY